MLIRFLLEKNLLILVFVRRLYHMAVQLHSVSTYLVDKIQKIFPDEDLAFVNAKISMIRKGIATMSSSAPSLYTQTLSSAPAFTTPTTSDYNIHGVVKLAFPVPEDAVYTTYVFPIFDPLTSYLGHVELLSIGSIKEYMLRQQAFTARPKIAQFIIAALLISNYACRLLMVIFAPALCAAYLIGVNRPQIVGRAFLLMVSYGMLIGPLLRQLTEYVSQPTCFKDSADLLATEIKKADDAIQNIEQCETALVKKFTEEDFKTFLETRRNHIDSLETFLEYASSYLSQQDVPWKIKASLRESNFPIEAFFNAIMNVRPV